MVRNFSEHESERAVQDAEFAKAVTEWDQRTKAHASELEQKIADYIKQKEILGVEHGINKSNNSVLLRRSTGTLEISFREIGSKELMAQEWEYSLHKTRSGNTPIERLADNQDLDRMNEARMAKEVMDWLAEK
jgi:hypothetical protein